MGEFMGKQNLSAVRAGSSPGGYAPDVVQRVRISGDTGALVKTTRRSQPLSFLQRREDFFQAAASAERPGPVHSQTGLPRT
jgi:hypothetical protein